MRGFLAYLRSTGRRVQSFYVHTDSGQPPCRPKNPGPPELPLTEDWTPKRTMPAVPAASRPPPACADLKLRSIGTRSSSLSSSSSSSVIVGGATGGGDLPLNPKVVSGFKRVCQLLQSFLFCGVCWEQVWGFVQNLRMAGAFCPCSVNENRRISYASE